MNAMRELAQAAEEVLRISDRNHEAWHRLRAALDAIGEHDALVQNAARYRFLRRNAREIVFGYDEAVTCYSGLDDPHGELDAAVDAAIATQEAER